MINLQGWRTDFTASGYPQGIGYALSHRLVADYVIKTGVEHDKEEVKRHLEKVMLREVYGDIFDQLQRIRSTLASVVPSNFEESTKISITEDRVKELIDKIGL